MKNANVKKIHEAWKEIKKYQKELGTKAKGIHFSSYSQFRRALVSSVLDKNSLMGARDISNYVKNKTLKNIKIHKYDIREFKQDIKYKVKPKTTKAEFKEYKRLKSEGKLEGLEMRYSDVKDLSTRDFADLIKDELKAEYRRLLRTMSGSEAKKEIAHQYFGS